MRIRQERINELLRQEISKLILTEVKDPRLGFVTVNRVTTNNDLSYAKVYITIMGKQSDVNKSLIALNSAKDYIKVQVGKKINIRYMPEIEFFIDTKMDETLKLLQTMEKDKEEHGY